MGQACYERVATGVAAQELHKASGETNVLAGLVALHGLNLLHCLSSVGTCQRVFRLTSPGLFRWDEPHTSPQIACLSACFGHPPSENNIKTRSTQRHTHRSAGLHRTAGFSNSFRSRTHRSSRCMTKPDTGAQAQRRRSSVRGSARLAQQGKRTAFCPETPW